MFAVVGVCFSKIYRPKRFTACLISSVIPFVVRNALLRRVFDLTFFVDCDVNDRVLVMCAVRGGELLHGVLQLHRQHAIH